eukprot:COSAG04_NODE_28615_length_274_cov_1.022857_2_plen_67_part_01
MQLPTQSKDCRESPKSRLRPGHNAPTVDSHPQVLVLYGLLIRIRLCAKSSVRMVLQTPNANLPVLS